MCRTKTHMKGGTGRDGGREGREKEAKWKRQRVRNAEINLLIEAKLSNILLGNKL